jgi:hypothetical protein
MPLLMYMNQLLANFSIAHFVNHIELLPTGCTIERSITLHYYWNCQIERNHDNT